MRTSLIALIAVLTVLAAVAPATAVAADGPSATAAQEAPTCEYPLSLEDGTGETVTIEEEPESVVALQPGDAQTLFEIGAEEKVVGMPVGPYTDYLDANESLDVTGSDGAVPVAEEVVDRDPDVVLAGNTLAGHDVIDQLRDAGLTVYVYPTERSLDGVAENVRLTGQIVGECEGAADTLAWMDERLSVVEDAVADEEHPLAYYAMSGGYTAGEATLQDEILTAAGVENLASEAGIEGWDTVSEEAVLEADPDWIVYGDAADEPPVGEGARATTAYENERFVAVDDNYLSQPGPRIVLAVERIVEAVHPEAYAEAEAALDDENATTDDENATAGEGNATADDEGDDGATDADGPDSIDGFGVPVAVAGVLAALGALARRR